MTTSLLGQRILLRRRDCKLSQAALAEAVGISTNTIARLERGLVQDLRGQTIRRLAEVLGVSGDYLLGMTTELGEPDGAEARTARPVRHTRPVQKPTAKTTTKATAPKRARPPAKTAQK
jgi:transcriptional regulator with XRE-family HTH domain